MEKQSYNFATAISMVIGVVIGSGIFFKADDILVAVNGNVGLGLLGFLIVGIGVLFGALSVSYYAELDQNNEGLIGYSKMALGRRFAYIVGWFSITCYFPTLMVILALLTADYLGMLLGIDSQLYITLATAFFLFTNMWINIKYPKASGELQVISTIAKLVPLIVIGLVGAFFFTNGSDIANTSSELSGGSPMTALIAIAFSFDGWIVATNIAGELEDSKKNLPRALALGSIVIMVVYMLYFYGVCQILSPSEIVALGDNHIAVAAQTLLGDVGSKVILLFVVISVYGGFNGMTLAYVRLPQEMVEMNLMKLPKKYKDNTYQFSIMIVSVVAIIWFIFEQLIDYSLIFTKLENPFDISSMPIMIIYIVYIVLFAAVNKFVKDQPLGRRLYYLVISSIAVITSIMIIVGTMEINGMLYIIMSIAITAIGIPFYRKQSSLE